MTDEINKMLQNLDAIRDEICKNNHLIVGLEYGSYEETVILIRIERINRIKELYKKRLINKINEL